MGTDQTLSVDEHHPQPLGRPPPSQGNKELLSPLSLGAKPEPQQGAGADQEHDSDEHSEDSWELLSGDDSPRCFVDFKPGAHHALASTIAAVVFSAAASCATLL